MQTHSIATRFEIFGILLGSLGILTSHSCFFYTPFSTPLAGNLLGYLGVNIDIAGENNKTAKPLRLSGLVGFCRDNFVVHLSTLNSNNVRTAVLQRSAISERSNTIFFARTQGRISIWRRCENDSCNHPKARIPDFR